MQMRHGGFVLFVIDGTQIQIGFQHPVGVFYFPDRIVALPKDIFTFPQ
jgi:hypothetical protein